MNLLSIFRRPQPAPTVVVNHFKRREINFERLKAEKTAQLRAEVEAARAADRSHDVFADRVTEALRGGAR